MEENKYEDYATKGRDKRIVDTLPSKEASIRNMSLASSCLLRPSICWKDKLSNPKDCVVVIETIQEPAWNGKDLRDLGAAQMLHKVMTTVWQFRCEKDL